ncbi:hypothetical protein [Candidatus Methylocalor cossyra]|uniref:MxaA protein n=1 Tax=Candidatus Methylocalor cossyra TaxID=3108543 RepID=A0ABM9NEP9_9GAMM
MPGPFPAFLIRLAAALALWSTAAYPAPSLRVELAAPRDYGYLIGDLIVHRLTVELPAAYRLEPGFLPRPGAVNDWLEIRSVAWDRTDEGDAARYRIRVTYQVFKGVRSPERATVPALPLRFTGPEPLTLTAPEWSFSLAPLIAPETGDEAVAIRAPRAPEPASTLPQQRRLGGFLAGALVLGAWLLRGRLGWSRRPQPFHRAYRELRRLLRGPASPETYRTAAKLLHRALDETAGYTVFAGQLDRFCQQRPAFAALRAELAEFFAFSQRLFFTATATPADYPPPRLEALCRRCAAAERRGR